MLYVKGKLIFEAALAGAECGYNRSTMDTAVYESLLEDCYDYCLDMVGDDILVSNIRKVTNDSWEEAMLPIDLALYHDYMGGSTCERHARVYLGHEPGVVFDIPLSYWHAMEQP